ncbi:uncharacterized protein EI90DRAFT_764058 [Cantharellus anzutake]|uniref:uncharacterized protein n=1 Tax=Cantharellus anzutake TaxID=1750568 RepID=UPI001905D666|nr:uncharacterized protein EI90DRAFT_764058 [Cantharellus anzutake]KAF8342570.1 hypothetical protein EI90DRAFT_764058 [Cantharellus anzutake]
MSEKNQKLVLAILDFLNASIQCIGEAFGVDPNDPTQCERLSIKPATLSSLFDVFSRTQSKLKAGASTTPTPPPASSSAPRPPVPSDADKKKAEEHKKEGNARMSSKDFDAAIQSYTKAIALDPSNPVYYSNRAAAYSSKDEHDKAIIDAKKALEVDPSFVKAYSRLG